MRVKKKGPAYAGPEIRTPLLVAQAVDGFNDAPEQVAPLMRLGRARAGWRHAPGPKLIGGLLAHYSAYDGFCPLPQDIEGMSTHVIEGLNELVGVIFIIDPNCPLPYVVGIDRQGLAQRIINGSDKPTAVDDSDIIRLFPNGTNA